MRDRQPHRAADCGPPARIHHAWWIALAAGLIYFVQGGLGSYALGVLLPAWVAEFGWPRTSISLAYTAGTLLPGLTGVVVGRWTDRYGPRGIIVAGATITGISYLLLAGVQSLVTFYLAFAIGAIGRCGTSQVPVSAAIARWFHTRRALAMGLASTGISIAGVLLVPLATYLVVVYGWRTTVVVLGIAIWLLIVPVVWLVMSGSPADRGLEPYGAGQTEKRRRPASVRETTLPVALHGAVFWLIAVAMTLGHSGSNSIGIHALPTILDKGVSPQEGAAAISLMAGCGLVGKVVFGWLGDRYPPTLLLGLSYGLGALGFLFLGLSGPGLGVWLFALVYGTSLGGAVALQGVVVAEQFGLTAYGEIYGAISLPFSIASALAPVVAGLARDVGGSYVIAFVGFAVLTSLGALLLAFSHFYSRSHPAG